MRDNDTFRLTQFGHIVFRAGGWIQYHNDKIEHDRLMREQIKSTIDTNKFQKTVLFSSIALSIATFFLALFTFLSNERLLDVETQRLEREKNQVIAPAINPNVNVTLQRDTIIVMQSKLKSK